MTSFWRAIHRVGAYQCEKCDFAAIKREILKTHVEAVNRDGAYQCDKCDFARVKREKLKSHVETDHKDGIINVMSVISQQ